MDHAADPPAGIVPGSSHAAAHRHDLRWTMMAVAAVPCALALALPALFPAWADLSAVFLVRQDTWLLLCSLGVLGIALVRLPAGSPALTLPAWAPWALAAVVSLFCFGGHRWILAGYDMSRDEQMAVFDSHVFARGLLAAPLPEPWRDHAAVLNTAFMLPASRPVASISDYLPMNAALRAVVGSVADPALTGPLMAGLGLPLVWGCAGRLWPGEREAASVAALLYLASGQVLFAGMTSYAMPAHLTLDLLWLRLFLADRRGADLGALAVALVATGLHQPLFHPLFALPFLATLPRDRVWPRLALYGAGYAAICSFWFAWPVLMRSVVDSAMEQPTQAGTGYLSRLLGVLTKGDAVRWADMAGNMLRFDAWQSVLLAPLMAAGIVLARRGRWTLALATSAALPAVVMAAILPYQGHGFGYRYLHGALGPAILLAVAGWRELARRDGQLRPLVVRATLLGLVTITPLQAAMAQAFYAPFAAIDAAIRASGFDYAVVGKGDAPFSGDLVFNEPDLSNRPIRLLGEQVSDEVAASMCRPGIRVALATDAALNPIDRYFGVEPSGAADARLDHLSATLRSAGCSTEPFDGQHGGEPKR